jgi:hypothetical protein
VASPAASPGADWDAPRAPAVGDNAAQPACEVPARPPAPSAGAAVGEEFEW